MPDRTIRFQNGILKKLSKGDIALLGPLALVDLHLHAMLEDVDMPIEFAYFIEEGVVSVVSQSTGQHNIEVGLVGREGMTGGSLVMADTRSPFASFVQIEGRGYRIGAAQLMHAIGLSTTLEDALRLSARAFHLQIAATSVAHGSAKLEARLARWLLMVGDRAGVSFHITHALLGMSLSVRRSGITLSLQMLEGRGLIRSGRGIVTIIDRSGLQLAASGTYGMAERELARLSEL